MALTLKRYQREALAALARFFALTRGARDEAALDAAFRQTLLEQEHTAEMIPPYLAQGFVNDDGATPYVCVRIPTGGGKTLLGAHALAAAARHYTGQDRPLALWLVPTNVIRQQTLSALKTPGHPYREALEAHFGVDGVRVLDIADSDQIRPQDIGARALVIVGTLQTLRVDDTSGRDVYAYKEAFEPHFERAPELPGFERVSERDLEVQPYLGRADLGKVKRSFANLMYWHRPVVIIDEAHNARTPLSYDSFARLRPAALIEMTATPVRQGRHRSNVLYHVSAEELQAEEMIKLPIVLSAHPNWEEAVRDALLTRTRLAEEAARELAAGGDYLRPILLLQAEDKRGEMKVERLREHLIAQENIAPERIAVATGTQRELDGVNLFDPACPVEVVITVEALKEGWDCSSPMFSAACRTWARAATWSNCSAACCACPTRSGDAASCSIAPMPTWRAPRARAWPGSLPTAWWRWASKSWRRCRRCSRPVCRCGATRARRASRPPRPCLRWSWCCRRPRRPSCSRSTRARRRPHCASRPGRMASSG